MSVLNILCVYVCVRACVCVRVCAHAHTLYATFNKSTQNNKLLNMVILLNMVPVHKIFMRMYVCMYVKYITYVPVKFKVVLLNKVVFNSRHCYENLWLLVFCMCNPKMRKSL